MLGAFRELGALYTFVRLHPLSIQLSSPRVFRPLPIFVVTMENHLGVMIRCYDSIAGFIRFVVEVEMGCIVFSVVSDGCFTGKICGVNQRRQSLLQGCQLASTNV